MATSTLVSLTSGIKSEHNPNNAMDYIQKLEHKAKTGWRNFFIMKDEFNDLSEFMRTLKICNKMLIDDVSISGQKTDNPYQSLFRQLYEKVNEKIRCHRCEERLVKNNMDIYKGRMICKGCRMDESTPPSVGVN